MLEEFSVLVGKMKAEEISDALLEEGAYSVSIEDADADTEQEAPIFGEPGLEPEVCGWQNSRLKILADSSFPLQEVLQRIGQELSCDAVSLEGHESVPDNDWVRITQAQFKPTHIGSRLWIVPSWHEPPDLEAVNIRLDPGVAFGTGTHPTTRLCLEWLESHDLKGKSVLDYGCGSGILAVAAKKLGAECAMGTDIDPQAVEAANLNAETNRADACFVLPEDMPDGTFDTVVANILSNPLRLLAPALLARVAPGGFLILSGILERQAEELIEIYRREDPRLPLSVWKTQDGWVCLAGQRTAG
jgi:ribosomal protein L11 methyltransferase